MLSKIDFKGQTRLNMTQKLECTECKMVYAAQSRVPSKIGFKGQTRLYMVPNIGMHRRGQIVFTKECRMVYAGQSRMPRTWWRFKFQATAS